MTAFTLILFIAIFLAFRYIKGLNEVSLPNWYMSLAFALKVSVGLYFLYIYTAVYGNGSLSADAGAFMSESKILNEVFYSSPVDYFKLLLGFGDHEFLIGQYLMETDHWDSGAQAIISDNRNILRVHSLIHFISKGNATIHVLIMCSLSLIGIKQIYLGLKERTSLSPTLLFSIIVLFPSLLFWSSGILKEPLLILGIGLFIRATLGTLSIRKKWLYMILGTSLMLAFKPYVLFSVIPAVLFYFIYTSLPKFKLIGATASLLLIGIVLSLSFPEKRDQITHLLSRKQYDFKNVGKGGLHAMSSDCFYFFKPEQIPDLKIDGDSVWIEKSMNAMIIQHGSIDQPKPVVLEPSTEKWYIYFRNDRSDGYVEVTMIDDSFTQLLKNIPQALVNSLLRPFPNDPGSWLKFPATIEVIFIYGFLFFALIRRRKLKQSELGIIYSIIIFILCLALIIGWVTPVLGAIVRYRIPAFIGIVMIALMLFKAKKNTT